MTIWLDNQLPPPPAAWMRATLSITCAPVRDLALQRASDHDIFNAALAAHTVVMTKDADFLDLVERHWAPATCLVNLIARESWPFNAGRGWVSY